MTMLYPLRFTPILRRYLWGGRRLGTMLGKQLDDGNDYAESWEVVDHGDDQSIVAHGPLKGTPLTELVRHHGVELLGRELVCEQFPLLFKLLDANRDLSVQVHPNDEQGARLDPPDLGKTEAWVVLHADPGSAIYAGLQPGVDRETLRQRIDEGATESCLHRFEPQVGDCVFIPAGTVHALGAGLVIAEIQQSSDTTFRLFDWNRVGADGQPRPLHVEQALDVIDFETGPVRAQTPRATDQSFRYQLIGCDKFVLDRCELRGAEKLGGDDRCHIVSMLAGTATVEGDPAEPPLSAGQTLLLPAAAGEVSIRPTSGSCMLLDMYLPRF